MISLKNDYSEPCCKEILTAIQNVGMQANDGYGTDEICEKARLRIKSLIHCADSDVHFLVGGTQCNTVVIAHALKAHEAVLSVNSGHINVHETGAIEASGHKVCVVDGVDGKLSVSEIETAIKYHCDEHMVKIKMIYYSNATEIGTIYSRSEMKAIYLCAKKHNCFVFIDGARLGNALTSIDNDVELTDLCKYSDVFYFGGTKNGALFGEALVIKDAIIREEFRYSIKQRGGLLAKGFLLGIQFNTLFQNNLYFNLARHANECAQLIQQSFIDNGYKLFIKTSTNQIFPIVTLEFIQTFKKICTFQIWEVIDDKHITIRLVCSWATKETDIKKCIEHINCSSTS